MFLKGQVDISRPLISRSEAASYIEAILGPEEAARQYGKMPVRAMQREYDNLKNYHRIVCKMVGNVPKTKLWNQVQNFINEQNQRQNDGQDLLPLPDFVAKWHAQAELAIQKDSRVREADLQPVKEQEFDVEDSQKSPVEEVPDPEKYTGSRDPKVQTEILNQQIRALARAGFNIYIPADKWRNMSPAERLEIVLSIPEDERKKVLQNVRPSQHQHPAGRRIRPKRDYGPDL